MYSLLRFFRKQLCDGDRYAEMLPERTQSNSTYEEVRAIGLGRGS